MDSNRLIDTYPKEANLNLLTKFRKFSKELILLQVGTVNCPQNKSPNQNSSGDPKNSRTIGAKFLHFSYSIESLIPNPTQLSSIQEVVLRPEF